MQTKLYEINKYGEGGFKIMEGSHEVRPERRYTIAQWYLPELLPEPGDILRFDIPLPYHGLTELCFQVEQVLDIDHVAYGFVGTGHFKRGAWMDVLKNVHCSGFELGFWLAAEYRVVEGSAWEKFDNARGVETDAGVAAEYRVVEGSAWEKFDNARGV